MTTAKREFESTEGFITILCTNDTDYTARFQKYKDDYSLVGIDLCVPKKLNLDKYPSINDISNELFKHFQVTNVYDLNDWKLI